MYIQWFRTKHGITVAGRLTASPARMQWSATDLEAAARAFENYAHPNVTTLRFGGRNSSVGAEFESGSVTLYDQSPSEEKRLTGLFGVTSSTLVTLLVTHELVHAVQSTWSLDRKGKDEYGKWLDLGTWDSVGEFTPKVRALRDAVGVTYEMGLDPGTIHTAFMSMVPQGTATRTTQEGEDAMAIAISVNMYAPRAWYTTSYGAYPERNPLYRWANGR